MPFQPLANYQGYQHVLMAGATFVHPGNGNVYFCACEQQAGIKQNLSVYRVLAGAVSPQLVKRYYGTVDSQAQITYGSAVIGPGGNMWVATSLVIPGMPKVTTTGFQGSFILEVGIDESYPTLKMIDQRLVAIETALANISQGGLDAGDREALDRLRAMLRL